MGRVRNDPFWFSIIRLCIFSVVALLLSSNLYTLYKLLSFPIGCNYDSDIGEFKIPSGEVFDVDFNTPAQLDDLVVFRGSSKHKLSDGRQLFIYDAKTRSVYRFNDNEKEGLDQFKERLFELALSKIGLKAKYKAVTEE